MILVVVFQSMAKQTMDSAPPSEGVALKKRKMWSHQVILHSSVCLSVFLSLHVCLSFSNRLCLPPSLSLPLSVSVSVCLLSLCLSVSLCLSLSLPRPLCLCLPPSLPPLSSLYISHSLLAYFPSFSCSSYILYQGVLTFTEEKYEGEERRKWSEKKVRKYRTYLLLWCFKIKFHSSKNNADFTSDKE